MTAERFLIGISVACETGKIYLLYVSQNTGWYKMQNNLKDDKCFVNWQESLSSKPSTAAAYKYGIQRFCEFTGKSPSQLIEEAREDYLNRAAPWELKHINQFEGFNLMLEKYPAANNTRLNWLRGVKSFYSHNKLPIIGVKTKISQGAREEYQDIPVLKIEDIRRAVIECGTMKIIKALILTFLSSGQGQAEIRVLKGRHLKNVVNGIAVIPMTRGKTKRRYTFFIGGEALEAIHEYKPDLKDKDYIFTHRDGTQLRPQEVCGLIARHCNNIGMNRAYFAPHRFRHYFKTALTGSMDTTFIEYLKGHKLPGVESSYFLGNQEKMLEQYLKNQHLLTVFTEKEILQKQYDELKTQKGADGLEKMEEHIKRLERAVIDSRSDMLRVIREELGLRPDQISDQLKIQAMLID